MIRRVSLALLNLLRFWAVLVLTLTYSLVLRFASYSQAFDSIEKFFI